MKKTHAITRYILCRNVKFSSTVPTLRQAESARHGDIVQERFIDSYYNLTVKTLMVVKWATQNCDNFSYVLKERWREGIDV